MRIALLSDIHSNTTALVAVLNSLKHEAVDEVFFLGDYCFGGPGSNECVDIVANYNELPQLAIAGNKEDYIEVVESSVGKLHPVVADMYEELGPTRVDYLKRLPRRITRQIGDLRALICHNPSEAKVFEVKDRLYREKNTPSLDALEKMSQSMEEDICIFGHYHLFMHECVNGKHFICAGSIGLPLNGDPRAQYMILEVTKEHVSTSTRYVDYSMTEVAKAFEQKGFFAKHYSWSLDTLLTMASGHNYIGTQDLRK